MDGKQSDARNWATALSRSRRRYLPALAAVGPSTGRYPPSRPRALPTPPQSTMKGQPTSGCYAEALPDQRMA